MDPVIFIDGLPEHGTSLYRTGYSLGEGRPPCRALRGNSLEGIYLQLTRSLSLAVLTSLVIASECPDQRVECLGEILPL